MIDEQYSEWLAWQDLCGYLRSQGIEPNDPARRRLIEEIKAWGESLVQLRLKLVEVSVR